MSDYGTYVAPTAPRSPRLGRSAGEVAKPPPVPPTASRSSNRSSAASSAEEAPRSPRSPRTQRAAKEPTVTHVQPTRYEPLVNNAADAYGDESGCPNCGTSIARPTAKFCDSCGYSLQRRTMPSDSLAADWTFDPVRYGVFGWIETVLGVLGMGLGYACFAVFQSPGEPVSSLRAGEIAMIGIMIAVFALLTLQRFFYREVFAFIYAILATGGAISAFIVGFYHQLQPGTFFLCYFFAWIMAMCVKLIAIGCMDMSASSSFRVEENIWLDSKLKLFAVAAFLAVVSLVGFILQLFILLSTTEEI